MSGGTQLSYSHGISALPLLGETVGENLRRVAAAWGGQEALVDVPSDRRWDYQQLDADVDAVAIGLLAAGVEAGARVGIRVPYCAEGGLVQYAPARMGAILVYINPAHRSPY